jgi:gluconolactonase
MLGDDTLVMANHGKRAIEKLNLETGEREIIVDNFNGNKFTSPNDLVLAKNGDIYFTDPPFGYKGLNDSFMKEIPHNGVYKYSASDGSVSLIDDSLNRPNGIALSPDEQFLYVPHSDPKASKIMRYTLWDNGFENGEVWLDTQADLDSGLQGNPDGLAVAADGTVYSSGPGGVLVISPEGKLLGRIMVGDDPMGKPTANCTLGGPDGKTLYITSQDTLARVRVKSGRY